MEAEGIQENTFAYVGHGVTQATSLGILRFLGVIIRVEAAKDNDPGELFNVWVSVQQLVRLLSQCKSLQQVRIIFDESSASWSKENGQPKSSLRQAREKWNLGTIQDYRMILSPFFALRNFTKAIVMLPNRFARDEQYVRKVRRSMKCQDNEVYVSAEVIKIQYTWNIFMSMLRRV
ncbi:uncharacterized protein PAC_06870 [Phialocephala subalpina]|uniref:Uncharacterized protein n=1 Tax=Phialocephala subalpina TaxID=576137 RepID=A0A1L7WW32_9HELO|nr:uncharacterized protein PAC_06870 [Phialocephala subalpina]